jgi:hypothetical protein
MNPVFHSINITTSLMMRSGSTHVLGRSNSVETGRHHVILVSANVTGMNGATENLRPAPAPSADRMQP